MIRINFCKGGASTSDWDINERVQFFKGVIASRKEWVLQDPCPVWDFSNMLLFDAFRAEIAEGKISLDDICFSYEDKPIEVNHYGGCNRDYPRQGKLNLDYSSRTLMAATKKHKEEREASYMERYGVKTIEEVWELRKREKEENPSLAKAIEEGQAPGPDRNSTTSREG